jgi:hypothetical protein
MHVQTSRLASIACASLIAALAGCSIASQTGSGVPPQERSTAARPAAQVAIYDNLGKGQKKYRCCIAWTIGGPRSKIGLQWLAAPFTPSADRTATSVVLALTWSLGANAGLTVALAPDQHGHPGKDIVAAPVPAKLPSFNHCCIVQSVSFGAPASLSKGVRYWVVVRTNAATVRTVDNWQNNSTNAGGIIASQNGKGWGDATVGKGLPAFAVFGP